MTDIVLDWQLVAAVSAAAGAMSVVLDRTFGRRDSAIKEVAERLQKHEVSDAAAFAELRAALAAMSRDQIGVESRILNGIDALRSDVRGVNERVDKILGGRA